MPTARDYRRIVLALDGAIERSHMGHPDFRANGRIFATLNHDESRGVVMLTPEQQERFVRDDPGSFQPGPGAWGRGGSTGVNLAAVDEETLGEALTLAWRATKNTKKATKGTKKVKR